MFTENKKFLPIFEIILISLILIFAYQFTYWVGQRGFFPFDQSIVFDGSYRVYSGQIPYKDFIFPFGPVTFWLQAAIFRFLGVSYASYIFGAAFVNVLVTGASYILLRRLFPQFNLPAFLGSVITSIWFYPPFGTPWPEQTAFFFSFIALLGITEGLLNEEMFDKQRKGLLIAAGLATFGAFLSKQNAGALIALVFSFLIIFVNVANLRERISNLTMFLIGWFVGLTAFAAWLHIRSDISAFIKYFFEIPAQEVGGERLPDQLLQWLQSLLVGNAPIVIKVVSLLSVLIAVIQLLLIKTKNQKDKRQVFSALLAPALFIYHNAFLITANNQVEISLPFIGVIAAIGLGLLLPKDTGGQSKEIDTAKKQPGFASLTAVSILLIGMVAIVWMGIHVSVSRQVHDIFKNSTFPNRLENGKLSAIKWAVPMRIGNPIYAEDVNNLVNYLEMQGENFFVFPDFTILYGTLGVPSPQPLLWFHRGLTYPKTYDPELDAWIVDALQRNQVRIIIIEEESWFHTDDRLADFPKLKSFITNDFTYQQRIGNFLIYHIREN
ncbi:hypothetical protein D6779_10720 [Candidatus Parcubacteria bacterium]|nr:MAG: hypothetical protein D6779_10720 [Candidatus Parcubacteria bacterium]